MAHLCTCVHMQTCMCARACVYTCVRACLYLCMCAPVRPCVHACGCASLRICVHTCVRGYMHVYVCGGTFDGRDVGHIQKKFVPVRHSVSIMSTMADFVAQICGTHPSVYACDRANDCEWHAWVHWVLTIVSGMLKVHWVLGACVCPHLLSVSLFVPLSDTLCRT